MSNDKKTIEEKTIMFEYFN